MKTIGFALLIGTIIFSSCREKYELATVKIDSIQYLTHASAIANCNAIDDGNEFIDQKGVCWSEKSPTTIADNCSDRGDQDTGKYLSPLFNLKPNTTYYIRAFAKNVEGVSYSDEIQIKTPVAEYFTDTRDNQSYIVVKIGEQYWMAENLNYYTKEGSRYYNNDSSQYSKYGRLYNWETACSVCPDGWHLPSNEDWLELEEYIGISRDLVSDIACIGTNEAGKLKEPGNINWVYECDSVTNETGFTAVPSGVYTIETESFDNLRMYAVFWSSTSFDINKAWFRRIESYNNQLCANYCNKYSGLSVRCIKNK